MAHTDRNQWLDAATARIRFDPDRETVRRELDDHIEDLRDRYIARGLSAGEAEARAIGEMGDAAELSVELGRLHRPWWGWLWKFRLEEKAALIPLTDIVLELTEDEFRRRTYVGLGEDVAVVYDGTLAIYPLTDGPLLIPLEYNTTILHDEAGQPFTAAGYVALCPPEGTDYAVLNIKNDDGWFSTRGDMRGDVFLFKLRPLPDENHQVNMGRHWFDLNQNSYDLRFYSQNDTLLGRITSDKENWPINE